MKFHNITHDAAHHDDEGSPDYDIKGHLAIVITSETHTSSLKGVDMTLKMFFKAGHTLGCSVAQF